jgi:hypothetical protein
LKSKRDYFKQQSLLYQMVDNALDLRGAKQNRVECLAEETAKLLCWCETGIKMISDKIKGLTGKTSRQEEIA